MMKTKSCISNVSYKLRRIHSTGIIGSYIHSVSYYYMFLRKASAILLLHMKLVTFCKGMYTCISNSREKTDKVKKEALLLMTNLSCLRISLQKWYQTDSLGESKSLELVLIKET